MTRRIGFTLALVAVTACGSDDPAGPEDRGVGSMSAVIDGAPWSSTGAVATINPDFNLNVVIGTHVASEVIGLVLGWEGRETGTYDMATSNVEASLSTVSGDWGAGPNDGGSGAIVVTVFTQDRVAGTFALEVVSRTADNISITDGRFDVPY